MAVMRTTHRAPSIMSGGKKIAARALVLPITVIAGFRFLTSDGVVARMTRPTALDHVTADLAW